VQSSIELELKSRLLLVERENLQLEYMLDQQNHFSSSKLLEQTSNVKRIFGCLDECDVFRKKAHTCTGVF